MKKIVNLLLILFFVLYIDTLTVEASVNSCHNSVKIKETTQAATTGWKANMYICGKYEFTGDYRTVGEGLDENGIDYTDFSSVLKIGRIVITAYQRSIDNKEVVEVQVPLCTSRLAGIGVKMDCEYYDYVEDATTSPRKTDAECKKHGTSTACIKDIGCEWYPNMAESEGTEVDKEYKAEPMALQIPGANGGECLSNPYSTVTKCSSDSYILNNSKCYKKIEYVWERPGVIGLNDTEDRSLYVREGNTYCRTNKLSTGDYGCNCKRNTIRYAFKCPIYECVKEKDFVDTCTASFEREADKVPVYCVNPAMPFDRSYNDTADYLEDTDFNVNDCASSFSTVDCGFANILIEGAYNNFSYKAIEFGLRLWGAYTDQPGYANRDHKGIGISNRRGASCNTSVVYLLDDNDELVNPYDRTVKEAYKIFFETISNKDYYNPKTEYKNISLNCSETVNGTTVELMGVACEGNNYKKGVALFFNTISGNKNMRTHLRKLFGNEISTEVKSALLKVNEKDEPYIEIKFPELTEITKDITTKVDCNDLDGMVSRGEITEEQKEYIESYCQIEISLVDEDGKPITYAGVKYSPKTPDYCLKDYCALDVKSFAICRFLEGHNTIVSIRVTYPQSRSSNSIIRYVSCSNSGETQTMFAIDTSSDEDVPKPTPRTREYPISRVACTKDCNEGLQGELVTSCQDVNATGKYGQVYKSSIKDPSLKCILNMESQATKNKYDYSDFFGVNKNVCRVYCSDEFEVSMPDKVLVKRNKERAFYYDVEFLTNGNVTKNQKLTTIVKEKRTCVSEIYYNTEFQDEIDWGLIYGLTDAQAAQVRNWRTLFSVMLDKAAKENGRTEILNQLIYDLYNCNFFSKEKFDAAGIIKPRNYTYDRVIDKLEDVFKENKQYGMNGNGNCTINNSTGVNTCISLKNVEYSYGGNPDGKNVNVKAITESKNNFDKLVYCKGNNCFRYVRGASDNYDYPDYVEIRPGQTNPYVANLSLVASDGTVVKINGSSTIQIPVSDYAMFEVENEVSYYNSERYDVLPNGGIYHRGTHSIKPTDVYMKLGDYAYSVVEDATNDSNCSAREYLTDAKRCNISLTFDKLNTFYRQGGNDDFSRELKVNKTYSCYVDIETPLPPPPPEESENGTRYRNVDPGNMFPSTSGRPVNGTNWATTYGLDAFAKITESAPDLIGTNEYLQYSITLSPPQIKKIRDYNLNLKGLYATEVIYNCQIDVDVYRNCKSAFLDLLRSSNTYGTIDLNYRDGLSAHDKKGIPH